MRVREAKEKRHTLEVKTNWSGTSKQWTILYKYCDLDNNNLFESFIIERKKKKQSGLN